MMQQAASTVVCAPDGGGRRRMLIVTHGYPPAQTNGAELQAQRKVAWWHARGHVVRVLAADPQPATNQPFDTLAEREEVVDGIPVRRLRVAVPDSTRSLRETYDHPLLTAAVERELVAFQPDVVYQVSGYLFGTAPLRIAAQHGVATVLFAMDYWHICQRITLLRPAGACCPGPRHPADCAACRLTARAVFAERGPAVQGAAWRVLARAGGAAPARVGARLGVADFADRQRTIAADLREVALVVVNSHFLGERLAHLGVPRERLLVVRQGIAAGEFPARAARQSRDHAGLTVLYLGQISRHKGTDLAITAVRQLRDAGLPVRLRLHGPLTDTGAYAEQVRAWCDDAAIHLGAPLDRAGVAAALAAADVLVVPSRWYENSPNVILEAFAAGVPVVAAGHGGMAEMVRDGVDGLLVQPGDVNALAGALRRLATEPGLLARLQAGVRPPYGVDDELAGEEAALAALLGAGARPLDR
ncbi:MAG TPA: glycosyltransferase [Thermomicrobiales bacterium]|nr:glycosyltransferase [Thermomicrobiales bacterium]